MFLDLIQTCHGPNRMVLGPNAILSCTECGNSLNAQQLILQSNENPFHSSLLALEYAKWTGDIKVLCQFPLVNVPGIVPKMIETRLDVLLNGIRLLRLLASPFFKKEEAETVEFSTLDEKILQNFLQEYIQTVQSMTFDKEKEEEQAIKALLSNMKQIFESQINFFDHYFRVIVPYVRHYCPPSPENEAAKEEENNIIEPSRAFYYQSQKSNWVRRHYGQYCIPLEVVHVMVYCYVCGRDPDVIANLCFQLGAKICLENMFRASPNVSEKISKILKTHVAYNKNTDLYYLIREMERGNTASCLSMEFLEKYGKLEKLISSEFLRQQPQQDSSDVVQFAFSQNFPYILYPSNEYYGFITCLGYLTSKLKSNGRRGTLEKGTFGNARRIFKFINMFIQRVREFEKSSAEPVFWTMDTFKLLLCSDELLHKELKEMIHFVMEDQQESRQPNNTNEEMIS